MAGCSFLAPVFSDEEISIQATRTEHSQGVTLLSGNVRFQSPGRYLLTADEASYTNEEGAAELRGNVKVDFYSNAGLIEIASQYVVYNLKTRSGIFDQVAVQFGEDYHFSGERIELHENGHYHFFNGILTACNQALPQWSMKIKEAILVPEGYSRLKGTTFFLKKVPVFYFPYLILPTMTRRQSGLLIPDTGHSQRNGTFFKIPYYLAPQPNWDMTLTPGYYDVSGPVVDFEFRYHTRPFQQGKISGYAMQDQVIKEGMAVYEAGERVSSNRYRYSLSHQQRMKQGALLLSAEQGSDYQVEWDFVEDINSGRIRSYYYDLWYGREWKNQYFSICANDSRYIFSDQSGIGEIQRLPSLNWLVPSQHIGKGFYLKSNAHVDIIDFSEILPEQAEGTVHYSLNAAIERKGKIGPYIFMNYGLSLLASSHNDNKDKRSGTSFVAGTLEMVGPKLYKSYRSDSLHNYLTYGFSSRYNFRDSRDFDILLEFDENDVFFNEQIKGLDTSWFIRSSLFKVSSKSHSSLLEIEMRKKVNTDTRQSPLEIAFRVPGIYGLHFNSLIKYQTDERKFDLLSFYGSAKKGNWKGYAGYVRRQIDMADQDSIILRTDLTLPRWKSGLHAAIDYDFLKNEFKSQQLAYKLFGQCMGMQISYNETPEAGTSETKKWYRLSFQFRSLGEIGSKF
ncbi:MAG: hypothetical protein CSA81_11320 [Acidobacteria bacterium]|nr:MAG: hypothetical protein CSA81_11320 [Acidobacteriota bacterium]PIE89965.1 MAG: hypothetical protein CR997_08280 [Acidobacteriota bacterium]